MLLSAGASKRRRCPMWHSAQGGTDASLSIRRSHEERPGLTVPKKGSNHSTTYSTEVTSAAKCQSHVAPQPVTLASVSTRKLRKKNGREHGIAVLSALDAQVTAADVVQSLVVHHGSKLSVFHQNVHAQDCFVRHNHGRRDQRTNRHREAEPRPEPVPPPMWHHMQSTPTKLLAGAIVSFLVRSEGGQRSSFSDGVVARAELSAASSFPENSCSR